MIITSNLHTHTIFCDGKNTPEEMVKKAIDIGFDTIGFSYHAYTPFDTAYCIKNEKAYFEEINKLKQKYSFVICILNGVEQDYYAPLIPHTDYIIGSVHYVYVNNKYIPIDESKEILLNAVNEYFNGDIYALIKLYYDTVVEMTKKLHPTFIGHFDLISKFNKNSCMFDPLSEKYKNIIDETLNNIDNKNIFEVNTSGIYKGNGEFYPQSFILKKMLELGFNVTISSDSHKVDTLNYGFSESLIKLKKIGFNKIVTFNKNIIKYQAI